MNWTASEARREFGQVVQRALDEGPQIVTRHGREVVVVLAAAEYRRLTGDRPSFKTFLLTGPDFSVLDLTRDSDGPREIQF
jgi:prevent-host-death family protein